MKTMKTIKILKVFWGGWAGPAGAGEAGLDFDVLAAWPGSEASQTSVNDSK